MATPRKFRESNLVLLGWPEDEERERVEDLHTFKDDRQIVSCWKLSWRERLSALLFGRVWLGVLTMHTAPPIWVQARSTVFDAAGFSVRLACNLKLANLKDAWRGKPSTRGDIAAVCIVAAMCSITLTLGIAWLLDQTGFFRFLK